MRPLKPECGVDTKVKKGVQQKAITPPELPPDALVNSPLSVTFEIRLWPAPPADNPTQHSTGQRQRPARAFPGEQRQPDQTAPGANGRPFDRQPAPVQQSAGRTSGEQCQLDQTAPGASSRPFDRQPAPVQQSAGRTLAEAPEVAPGSPQHSPRCGDFLTFTFGLALTVHQQRLPASGQIRNSSMQL